MKSRLFLKIFATYFFLILLVVAVFDFLLTPHIREIVTRSIEEKLVGQARIVTLLPGAEIRNRISEIAEFANSRVTFIDASGRVITDSESEEIDMDNHLNRSEVQEARLKGIGTAVRYSRTLQENMLYVALPVKANKQITGYVRLARPLREVRESIDHVYRYLYLTLFIIALPSTLLAFIFARRITSPIRRIKEFTQKIRNGDSPGTLFMDSQDEIGQLARDINYLLQEQQEKIRLATEEKSKLEAAFASMVEGVMILDGENRIEACNQALGYMLGKTNHDILDKTILEAFHSLILQDALNQFRKSGEYTAEAISLGEEEPLIVEVNISYIKGLPSEAKKIIMAFHDVTRLRRLERVRSDFIANVTHELKTPLTAIIGYVETLQNGALGDGAVADKFLNIINDHARRLDRLVNDLLTISDLEQGEAQLHMEALPVHRIMDNVLPVIQERAEGKGLPIIVDLPPKMPVILGDRDKVTQILVNVLDNAVNYTSSGKITIKSISLDEEGYVALQIIDTGVGIPKNEIPRLGERFYRVDRARSRELGGTGLGLSIVKHLMKAHHGWMEIESSPGRGTTVTLAFPTA